MRRSLHLSLAVLLAAMLVACGESAHLPVEAGMGPQPKLPPPDSELIPTVNIAPAVGWTDNPAATPEPAVFRADRS